MSRDRDISKFGMVPVWAGRSRFHLWSRPAVLNRYLGLVQQYITDTNNFEIAPGPEVPSAISNISHFVSKTEIQNLHFHAVVELCPIKSEGSPKLMRTAPDQLCTAPKHSVLSTILHWIVGPGLIAYQKRTGPDRTGPFPCSTMSDRSGLVGPML